MESEITATILKLKSLLSEKYGKDFRQFYLVNDGDKWQGLITKKEKNTDEIPGKYYTIENECVKLVD